MIVQVQGLNVDVGNIKLHVRNQSPEIFQKSVDLICGVNHFHINLKHVATRGIRDTEIIEKIRKSSGH